MKTNFRTLMLPAAWSPYTRNFPSIRATKNCKVAATSMKITRQVVADKIADYLHGKVSQEELVDWAERAMIDTDFEETDIDLLTDIVGRLGLADVVRLALARLRRISPPTRLPRQSNRVERIIWGAHAAGVAVSDASRNVSFLERTRLCSRTLDQRLAEHHRRADYVEKFPSASG